MQTPAPVKQSLHALSSAVHKAYDNFIVGTVNDHCLRMAVMEGEYRWHYHELTDELFIVLEGELKIEFKESESVCLQPGEYLKIPAGMLHKTSATRRTVNLTVERNGDDTVFVDA